MVHLGSLTPDDVAVELLHGPVVAGDELTDTEVVRLRAATATWRPRRTRRPGAWTRRCAIGAGSAATRPAATATPCGSCRPTRIWLVPVEMGCVAWA